MCELLILGHKAAQMSKLPTAVRTSDPLAPKTSFGGDGGGEAPPLFRGPSGVRIGKRLRFLLLYSCSYGEAKGRKHFRDDGHHSGQSFGRSRDEESRIVDVLHFPYRPPHALKRGVRTSVQPHPLSFAVPTSSPRMTSSS